MGRPIGSKNKPSKEEQKFLEIANGPRLEVVDQRLKPREEAIHYDAIFGIRAFREGRWKGLWELVKISNEGKRTVITDANSRGMMINLINRELTKIVIGA